MLREAAPDRHHLAVRGRVAVGASEIAAARDDRAVAHDHRAERKIGLPRLLDRDAHEALVLGRGGRRRKLVAGKTAAQARPAIKERRLGRTVDRATSVWQFMDRALTSGMVRQTNCRDAFYSAARLGASAIVPSTDGAITPGILGRHTWTMPKHSGFAAYWRAIACRVR